MQHERCKWWSSLRYDSVIWNWDLLKSRVCWRVYFSVIKVQQVAWTSDVWRGKETDFPGHGKLWVRRGPHQPLSWLCLGHPGCHQPVPLLIPGWDPHQSHSCSGKWLVDWSLDDVFCTERWAFEVLWEPLSELAGVPGLLFCVYFCICSSSCWGGQASGSLDWILW